MPAAPQTPTLDIEFLSAVLAQTSDVVLVLRRDGSIAASVGSENMGYSEAEALGRDVFDFIDPGDLRKARAGFERAVQGESLQPIDVAVVNADGSKHLYEVAPARIPDAEGDMWIVVVLRDIHHRRVLETSVRSSEERYRALVEQSPLGILVVDDELNLVAANQAYADQVGAPSLEALRGHNIMASPGVDEDAVKRIGDRIRNGETLSTSLSYESIFGKKVDVRVNVAPARNEAGEFVAAQMIFEDVSESRRLEEQLRQSQKMEAVGRLAGGVAHDFNNNLTIILGLAEQLAGASVEPDEREAVNEIVRAAERSAALTNQLLAFSRRDQAELVGVDINRVVAQLEPMLRRVLGARVELSVSLTPDPVVIEADARLLEQVIVNLALNARDAMPNGGNLSVRVSEDSSVGVRLEIEDDGEGMDEETRVLSVEPFFTTKSGSGGTGLGLCTVYGIVCQFNGSMQLESELGRGTRVSIQFPILAGLPPKENTHRRDGARTREVVGCEVVLVLEDQPSVRKFLCKTLERQGYTVLSATDGAEAIDRARSATPPVDLIVSDVHLPDISGPETVATLRAEHPDLQVIYISGYTDLPRDADGRLEDGFELIAKPFSVDHLLSRVRSLMDERVSQPRC